MGDASERDVLSMPPPLDLAALTTSALLLHQATAAVMAAATGEDPAGVLMRTALRAEQRRCFDEAARRARTTKAQP